MDDPAEKKRHNDILELINTINKLDIIEKYKLHSTTGEYTSFSSAYGTFHMIDHILGLKT